jgi:hypothetical protein
VLVGRKQSDHSAIRTQVTNLAHSGGWDCRPGQPPVPSTGATGLLKRESDAITKLPADERQTMLEPDNTPAPVGASAWRRWGQAALWTLAALVILAFLLY